MRILFFGHNNSGRKFLEFLNERNPQATMIIVEDFSLLKEELEREEVSVVVLDMTSVPGNNQEEKFSNLGGIEEWYRVKEVIKDWQEGEKKRKSDNRICHCISDCVLGPSFLEKDGEVKLYFSSPEKSSTLNFPDSRFETPVKTALHTAASLTRNRWERPF